MKRSHRHLFPLYLVVFLAYIGYSSMITVFTPMMMQEKWGIAAATDSLPVRMTYLGFLLALYPFGQFIGSPLFVALAKRFDKKRILLLSLCLTAISYAWIAWSLHLLQLGSCMAGVFVAGFSEANESIAEDAIAQVAVKEHHSKLMSYLHVSSSGAFLFGPILSGVLSLQGLETPFWGVFYLFVIGFLITLFIPAFPKVPHPIKAIKTLRDQFAIFSLSRFHFAFAVNSLIYFAIFGFFRAYPMHLVEAFQFDIYNLSYYIAWVAVPIVLVNLRITTLLLNNFHPSSILTIGSFGIALFIGLLLLASQPGYLLWASLFLTAACIGICLPTSPVFIAHSVHKSILSSMLENDLAVLKGAEAMASICGGALAAVFIQLPLIVFAAIAFFAASLLTAYKYASSK